MNVNERTLETMASELEMLAARLRRYAPGLASGNIDVVWQASLIVNEYTVGVGNIGGRLGDIVRNAGEFEAEKIRAGLNS